MTHSRILIPVLIAPFLLAGAAKSNLFTKKLSKDGAVLHAVNRLTFGPRPGDIAAVTKIGLKKWIDRQLHPDRIPENPELLAELQPLDTLRMNARDMLARYPRKDGPRPAAKRLDELLDPDQRGILRTGSATRRSAS